MGGKKWTSYYCKMIPKKAQFFSTADNLLDFQIVRQKVELRWYTDAGAQTLAPISPAHLQSNNGRTVYYEKCGPKVSYFGKATLGLKLNRSWFDGVGKLSKTKMLQHLKFEATELRDAFVVTLDELMAKSHTLLIKSKKKEAEAEMDEARKFLAGDKTSTLEKAKAGIDKLMGRLRSKGCKDEPNMEKAFQKLKRSDLMKDTACKHRFFQQYWNERESESTSRR